MRNSLFGLGAIVALALVSHQATFSQNPSKTVDALMAQKLKSSQQVLEGISVGNFKKITAGAEQLIQLTKTEEWLVHKTPRYQTHSNEFLRAAETLIRKSEEKNLDGATLAFFDMTMSCVRCHQYAREIRDVRHENVAPVELVTER